MEDLFKFKMENMFTIKPSKTGTLEIFFCGEYERTVTTREEAERHITQCLNIPYHVNRLVNNILKSISYNLHYRDIGMMIDDTVNTCLICGSCWHGQYNGFKHDGTKRHVHNMDILWQVGNILKQPNPNITEVLFLWDGVRGRNRSKSRV